MIKPFFSMLMLLFITLILTFNLACSKSRTNIEVVEIEDEALLSQQIRDFIEQNKQNSGFYYFIDQNSKYTILIVFMGQKNTAGYDVKIKSVQDIQGVINVVVEEIEPSTDDMVAQVLTYPYTIVRFAGTTENIVVKTVDGRDIEKIR